VNKMSEDFEDYIKVKNLRIVDDEPHLIRIRNDNHTVAHIEILPTGDFFNIRIYSVSSDDERKMVKWVAGLPLEDE